MRKTFWNIENNEQKKVAGPYTTVETAIEARIAYYPLTPKLFVVEYEIDGHPFRASPFNIP